MAWEIVSRPGYFGEDREKIITRYNRKFGKSNWRIAWQWGDLIIQKPEALQMYEDGYYEFFKNDKNALDWLTRNFSNVYDTAPTNVHSKFDYNIQETASNHLHDIAIRRAVLRNGVWFEGKELLEVRNDRKGYFLNPHIVPFHNPGMIYKGKINYKDEKRNFLKKPPWWLMTGIENSVEQFYQQNKVLEVNL